MKRNTIVKINIILIILWLGVIFYFSAMTSDESNEKSKNIITKVTESVNTSSTTSENDTIQTDSESTTLVDILNTPLRKFAHASVYFVLCLLTMNLIVTQKNRYRFSYSLIAISFCFLYACTDEFHQLYVEGRTGQFIDCMIDTLGASIGCFIYLFVYKKYLKEKV